MDRATKEPDKSREVIHASETSTATVKISGGRIAKFSGFESDSEEDDIINHVDACGGKQNKTLTSNTNTGESSENLDIPVWRSYRKRSEAFSESSPDFSSLQSKSGALQKDRLSQDTVSLKSKNLSPERTEIMRRLSPESNNFNKRFSLERKKRLSPESMDGSEVLLPESSNSPKRLSQESSNGLKRVSMESSDSLIRLSPQSDNVTPESSLNSSPQKESSIPRERFNPFNRVISIDDDHFSESSQNYFTQPGTQSSGSTKSGSGASDTWTDLMGGQMSEISDADEVSYADLGLAEDHFSHPEGHFGLSSGEELDLAIENCVELIKLAPQNSDKQKNLVRKLVQLRMKKQELREGPEPCSPDVKIVVGHKFREKTSRSSKHYCEKCNAVIWGMLQAWYKCIDCGYSCHAKCLILITRTCAKVRVTENPSYCLSICPQKGLASQNYRCAECKAPLSFKSGGAEPRLCDYNGCFYCEFCHWNDTMPVPARVLHNWDFIPQKVCRASRQYLKLMHIKAVIRIQDINPMLFNFVEELSEIKKLREEMLIMKKYILLCPAAMKMKLLLLLQSRQHFVEGSDIYSMKDLMDIQTDTLLSELAQVHSSWAQHIKTDCELCQARGFFCEMCDEKEVLFPFDNIAVVCSQCSNVIHRHCYARQGGQCPRCERRDRRKVN